MTIENQSMMPRFVNTKAIDCRSAITKVEIQPAQVEAFVEAQAAADFLKVSTGYLKKLARGGKVPAHPRGDGQRRRWLFLISELAGWMRASHTRWIH